MPYVILTIGADAKWLSDFAGRLPASEYDITTLSPEDCLQKSLSYISADLVIIASHGEPMDDGLSLVRNIKARHPALPVFLVTRHSSEQRVIAAMRAGVNDYFKPPLCNETIKNSIDRYLQANEHDSPRTAAVVCLRSHNRPVMIGQSPPMRSTKQYLIKVAATGSTVLITGETGTGKEVAAEYIHQNSRRAKRPLVMVNCASLPESLAESELFGHERGAFTGAIVNREGKFAQANGGTIFLDEIGDMPPPIQAKILHTIERKVVYPLGGKKRLPLDVRVIAATNKNPEQLIAQGRFREDLFYRLNIARVQIPPLRHRKDDLAALVAHGIKRLNHRFKRDIKGLSPNAMALLHQYDWPGNVRELMNLLEASYVNMPSNEICYADLPPHFRDKLVNSQGQPLAERRAILSALLSTNWNKSQAARKLHWSRMTLYRKMAHYNIVKTATPA